MKSLQRPGAGRSTSSAPAPSAQRGGPGRGNAFLAEQLRSRAETAPMEGAGEASLDVAQGVPALGADHDHDHATGAAPDRAGAAAAATAGRTPGQELGPGERAAVLAQLRAAPTSGGTLAALEKTEGGLDFPMRWSARGTYCLEGGVYLDVRATGTELAVTLSHELVHLLNARNKAVPGVRDADRETFVQGMMADEIDAETASLLGGLQVTGGKGEPRSVEFKAWLEKAHPGLLPRALKDASLWPEVRAIARTWAEKNFRSSWKTSTTGQNYYDYWGSFWDKNNARGGPQSALPGQADGAAAARANGTVDKGTLPASKLSPLSGKLTGREMLINDNPETFRSPGLIGSTIAPMKDRGDATHDFTGGMRYFGLAQNGTGKALRNSIVVKNQESRALTFTLKGVIFGKNVTKTDGKIPKGYGPSGFRGPHAVAASSYLDAKPGQNGFIEKKVKVGPGEIKVLNEQYHEAGDEIFSLVDITCDDPKASFRIAAAESAASLKADDLAAIGKGTYPSAGVPGDFAPADRNRLGRPNGVASGSIVTGGRSIALTPGLRTGDLALATRFKHAPGADTESARLTSVPGNKGGTSAASIDEGNYGMEYHLSYVLKNATQTAQTCEVLFTAPKLGAETHKPLGGELTIPMNVNGQRRNVRVSARGEGVVVGTFTVAPGKDQKVDITFVHMGNTFPPAGFEFRVP